MKHASWLLLGLAACAANPARESGLSIRVAGFVESSGIT